MANLKSGLILRENENLVMELEAELWATSMNPIARLIGSIVRVFNLILGNKRRGFIVITDKRVMEVIQFKSLWVLNSGKNVKEVGYTKHGTCFGCFCQQYNLYYESFTQATEVMLPVQNEKEAQRVVDAFYKAITAAQTTEAKNEE